MWLLLSFLLAICAAQTPPSISGSFTIVAGDSMVKVKMVYDVENGRHKILNHSPYQNYTLWVDPKDGYMAYHLEARALQQPQCCYTPVLPGETYPSLAYQADTLKTDGECPDGTPVSFWSGLFTSRLADFRFINLLLGFTKDNTLKCGMLPVDGKVYPFMLKFVPGTPSDAEWVLPASPTCTCPQAQ